MIGYWTKLPDGSLGVRVKGVPVIGANIIVRFADKREPAHETVSEIVGERDGDTLCRIKRTTT